MSNLSQQSRDHLLAARVALFEADLALACDDHRRARVQLDLAQAHTVECRKLLLMPPAPLPAPRSDS